jgi:hypothetical protein
MVPDDWVWAGIVAAILSLVALQPIVYRFLASQFWPYGVRFTFHPQVAQAGGGVVLNVEIRNRTSDNAYFAIGARWAEDPNSGVRSFRFVHTATYRHVPRNEALDGHLVLAPYEFDRVVVLYTPSVRGHYDFVVELNEYAHWSRFPNWVAFNRKVLRRKNPDLHLLEYSTRISFDADTWRISPEAISSVIGRPLTDEERAADAEFEQALQDQAAANQGQTT